MIFTLTFLTFTWSYRTLVLVPALTQIATDFGITTGTAGLVVAAYSVPAMVIPLLLGPYSDRAGRKRLLVLGPLIIGVFSLVGAVAWSFPVLVGLQVVAGIGSALTLPNVFATVGDSIPTRDRARAISMTVTGIAASSVLGIPASGIISEATSWRLSLAIVGILAVLASRVVARGIPYIPPRVTPAAPRAVYLRILGDRSAMAVVIVNFVGTLYWQTWITYLVVFFQRTYELSQGTAATFALTTGVGMAIGTQIAGGISARLGHMQTLFGSYLVAGVLLLVETSVPLGLITAATINLLLSGVIGGRGVAHMSLLTEHFPEARGSLFAVSWSLASVGSGLGATVGGLLIDSSGFEALGVFCFVSALVAAAIVRAGVDAQSSDMTMVRPHPIDVGLGGSVDTTQPTTKSGPSKPFNTPTP